MDTFTQAYIECALWSEMDDSDTPLDSNYGVSDIADDAMVQIDRDCAAFQSKHWNLIASDPKRAGHDFWLTRNRHGAGFWDGDWPEPDATALTDYAHSFGEISLYVGDDGKLYL